MNSDGHNYNPHSYIGKPINRVDGRAKVTGQAKYSAEWPAPDLVYGVVVSSTIAKGRIKRIDAEAASNLDGVLGVFTHENTPTRSSDDAAFLPLSSDKIQFSGQPVALVVAETFELARYAASLIQVDYRRAAHKTDLELERERAKPPKGKKSAAPTSPGKVDAALHQAEVRLEAEYRSPFEHHNPIELFATTVVWDANTPKPRLTIYDKTQGVFDTQKYVADVFELEPEQVQVSAPFVGGAFGSGLEPQYQLFLAVTAALALKRSVRVSMTRQQMFTFGHRPATIQCVTLGATAQGKLTAIRQTAVGETSRFDEHSERVVDWSGVLYACDTIGTDYRLAKLDVYTPMPMRAPGATLGVYALETAMDELAHQLNIDPVDLRLINYAEDDHAEGKPFSSKELRECFRQGAERFGWRRRSAEPRSMRDGHMLIGWGVATGIWGADQDKASAKAVLTDDGKLEVASGTADIGTGTYTIMTQIAAEQLGLPIEDVTFKLGDTSLPKAPSEGGSTTAATVGPAVQMVCRALGAEIFKLAQKVEGSPLADAQLDEVQFADGQVCLKRDPAKAISFAAAMRAGGVTQIEQSSESAPDAAKQDPYSKHAHSAVFVEVQVDEDLGTIRVSRVVSAVAGGRILNPKTAANQVAGSVVWGIGMALEEESVFDHRFGRIMNHNLAEYHVPVNADVGDIDVIFVQETDDIVNPLGVKGLGEIGLVGVAAAISNAVFHATGQRVRDLPITLDKLL